LHPIFPFFEKGACSPPFFFPPFFLSNDILRYPAAPFFQWRNFTLLFPLPSQLANFFVFFSTPFPHTLFPFFFSIRSHWLPFPETCEPPFFPPPSPLRANPPLFFSMRPFFEENGKPSFSLYSNYLRAPPPPSSFFLPLLTSRTLNQDAPPKGKELLFRGECSGNERFSSF